MGRTKGIREIRYVYRDGDSILCERGVDRSEGLVVAQTKGESQKRWRPCVCDRRRTSGCRGVHGVSKIKGVGGMLCSQPGVTSSGHNNLDATMGGRSHPTGKSGREAVTVQAHTKLTGVVTYLTGAGKHGGNESTTFETSRLVWTMPNALYAGLRSMGVCGINEGKKRGSGRSEHMSLYEKLGLKHAKYYARSAP